MLPEAHAAALDADGMVTSCTSDAWRWLGWTGAYPGTDIVTRIPAEMALRPAPRPPSPSPKPWTEAT